MFVVKSSKPCGESGTDRMKSKIPSMVRRLYTILRSSFAYSSGRLLILPPLPGRFAQRRYRQVAFGRPGLPLFRSAGQKYARQLFMIRRLQSQLVQEFLSEVRLQDGQRDPTFPSAIEVVT